MKFSFLFLLGAVMLISGQCVNKETEDCHRFVTIVNNSDYRLDMSISNRYPDSLNEEKKKSIDLFITRRSRRLRRARGSPNLFDIFSSVDFLSAFWFIDAGINYSKN